MIPYEFTRLVQERNSSALVIVAHFAVAVACVRNVWYNENWGQYALQCILNVLDEEMQPWLRWYDFMSDLRATPRLTFLRIQQAIAADTKRLLYVVCSISISKVERVEC